MAIISAPSNYGIALLIALAIGIFIWVPGLLWNAIRPRAQLPTALIPLPGFLYLVLLGALLWVAHPVSSDIPGIVAVTPGIGCLLILIWRWYRGARPRLWGDQGPAIFVLWAALTVGAGALGVNRLPVAQELFDNSIMPGRLVASPPDHVLPYITGVYFFHGYDGHTRSDAYFESNWSVTSRGPLIPFAIVSLMHAFHATPTDPPSFQPTHWPTTNRGEFIARVLGWMTNAFVILGVGYLLRALNVSAHTMRLGFAWTCLAPAIIQNTVFVWPKALAAFFLLLATTEIIRRRWEWGALWLALAWLSHPAGLLFAPGLGLFLLWHAHQNGDTSLPAFKRVFAPTVRFGAAFVSAILPWALYKIWLGRHDMFFDYVLAAGHVPDRAESLVAWLRHRGESIWNTLVPGSFFFGGPYRGWVNGPLTEIQRWDVQYTKTLAAGVGTVMVIPTYFSLLRRNERPIERALRIWLVYLTLCIMFIYWGWSNDALGRGCLEPLVPIVIALAVANLPSDTPLWNIGLATLWLEGRWIELSGMISAKGFTWTAVPVSSWILWAIGIGASLVIVRITIADRLLPVFEPERSDSAA